MMKPCIGVILLAAMANISPAAVITLDGDQWRLATDPRNFGREEGWFEAPRTNAVGTRVSWIIQDAFPGYHGVAWYWREFNAPPAHRNEEPILRTTLKPLAGRATATCPRAMVSLATCT